jgi:hypothetical protein
MGRMSRQKGAAGEREVATLLRPKFPDVHTTRSAQAGARSQQSKQIADLGGVPFRIEVKRQKKPNIRAAYKQACECEGDAPAVAITRADRDVWLATMSLGDWLELFES